MYGTMLFNYILKILDDWGNNIENDELWRYKKEAIET